MPIDRQDQAALTQALKNAACAAKACQDAAAAQAAHQQAQQAAGGPATPTQPLPSGNTSAQR